MNHISRCKSRSCLIVPCIFDTCVRVSSCMCLGRMRVHKWTYSVVDEQHLPPDNKLLYKAFHALWMPLRKSLCFQSATCCRNLHRHAHIFMFIRLQMTLQHMYTHTHISAVPVHNAAMETYQKRHLGLDHCAGLRTFQCAAWGMSVVCVYVYVYVCVCVCVCVRACAYVCVKIMWIFHAPNHTYKYSVRPIGICCM
jgi:hypothetical protein